MQASTPTTLAFAKHFHGLGAGRQDTARGKRS